MSTHAFISMLKASLLSLCLLSLSGFAQQPIQSGPLTNQRIMELVHAGVRADELVRMIAAAPEISFDLTPAAEDRMLKAGVTEDTIKAMAAREAGIAPGAPGQQSSEPTYQPNSGTPGGAEKWSPRGDVFAGYSYLNIDTNGLTSRQSLNGWETSLSFSANRWIAGEGAFAGYYKNNVLGLGLAVHDYSFLGGPRVNLGRGFFHALVGVDRLTGSLFDLSASQNSFAAAFGGGVQSKAFGGHWAIRSSADYVLSRHNIFGGAAFTQNNFRVGGGIVYIFGPFSQR